MKLFSSKKKKNMEIEKEREKKIRISIRKLSQNDRRNSSELSRERYFQEVIINSLNEWKKKC